MTRTAATQNPSTVQKSGSPTLNSAKLAHSMSGTAPVRSGLRTIAAVRVSPPGVPGRQYSTVKPIARACLAERHPQIGHQRPNGPAVDAPHDVLGLQPRGSRFLVDAAQAELGQIDVERLAHVLLPVEQVADPFAEIEEAVGGDDREQDREHAVQDLRRGAATRATF